MEFPVARASGNERRPRLWIGLTRHHRTHRCSKFVSAGLRILMWPIGYAMWMSFTPSEMLLPPTGVWSLRWSRTFFARSECIASLRHGLVIGALSAAISVACGATATLAVTRCHFPGRRLLESAVIVPLSIRDAGIKQRPVGNICA